MEEIYTNIYRESRKKAGLEQSEAADMIAGEAETIVVPYTYFSGVIASPTELATKSSSPG